MSPAPGIFGRIMRKREFGMAPIIPGIVPGRPFADRQRAAPANAGKDRGNRVRSAKSSVRHAPAAGTGIVPVRMSRRRRAVRDDGPSAA